MKKIALIFAGGVGSRMYSRLPKQFLEINGKPIIIQTLELFETNPDIDEIYIACVASHIDYLKGLIKKFRISKISAVFPGGETGQDSIYIGLTKVKKDHKDAVVLIHDGVRPLVDQKTISDCITDVKSYGSAITAAPAFETPIVSRDGKTVDAMLDRNVVYVAKAPQCFKLSDILSWHEQERATDKPYKGIVDSCGLAFKYGVKPHITLGNRGNVKVTTMEDYLVLVANATAENYAKLFELKNNRKEAEKR
jgi:2-C-methyl-D-erythritol 4-phosphate cytidylyltransferase